MMRRLLLLLLVTVGGFSMAGCNILNQGVDIVEEQQQEAAEEAATAESALPSVPEDAEEFAEPVVEATTLSATVVAPDLIRSTDPTERALGVQRTRPDPFASLPIPPTAPEVILPEGAEEAGATQGGGTAGGAQAGGGTATLPRVQPGATISPLPQVPQPDTARAVRVSGVVQIGGVPYAIIQAPGEVERYVRTGERVAGGRVLVKRIDTRSVEPRVILEQNGIEVAMPVSAGAGDVASGDETPEPGSPQAALTSSTTAALPNLPAPGL